MKIDNLTPYELELIKEMALKHYIESNKNNIAYSWVYAVLQFMDSQCK